MSSELGLSPIYHPLHPVLDGVGIFYIAGCGTWTVMITCGMIFLYTKRRLPFLRIRRLKLSFLATAILHLFWILILIGYTLAPVVPEQLIFWMTCIYYPIGLGLFFISNAELLEVARLQQRFVDEADSSDFVLLNGTSELEKPKGRLRGAWHQLSRLDFSLRMILLVAVGWVFQLVMTLIMWFASRKFHSAWGIDGTQVTGDWYHQHMAQGKGWEWWPAIACQFFWYWVVAPLILWRARRIKDTHGWRLQTSVCCISVFVALPLWLIALYAPGMRPVNRWWIPLAWIGISIWFIEAFTVWIPCYQVLRHHALQQDTLDAIALWESKTKSSAAAPGAGSRDSPTRVPPVIADLYAKESVLGARGDRETSFENNSIESLFTMHALEHTLELNPEPLRHFAAFRDFSGENVSFLSAVREWKALWSGSSLQHATRPWSPSTRRRMFKQAVKIYANYVSHRHALFPINISDRDYRELHGLFGDASRILYGGSEASSDCEITPFSNNSDPMSESKASSTPSDRSDRAIFDTRQNGNDAVDFVTDKVQYWGYIAPTFDERVFDIAVRSVKYLVLTNTWPKYIKEHRPNTSGTGSRLSHNSSRTSTLKAFFSFASKPP